MALYASYAAEKLPNTVEDMVRDIYTYMKYSFKRQSEYKEFQVFVDTKPHKLLQMCQTRWLSLHSCVKRILEQYDALKLYFQSENLIDNKAAHIFKSISNPFTKLYLYFLDFVLPILTNLNIAFQAENPQIHNIYSKVATAYKTLLECYVKPNYLNSTDLPQVQYRNPAYYLATEDIYLGGKCTAVLSVENNFSKTDITQFVEKCLCFYIECCHQLYKRFPLNSKHMNTLKLMSFLDPKSIKNTRTIAPAAVQFEHKLNLDLNNLDVEWRQLKNQYDLDFTLDLLKFWKTVSELKTNDGNEVYPLINKLVTYMLILPHSSACVERLFSSINLNKTKLRNQLSTETLTGILYSKSLTNSGNSCYNFDITKEMILKHNNDMYV